MILHGIKQHVSEWAERQFRADIQARWAHLDNKVTSKHPHCTIRVPQNNRLPPSISMALESPSSLQHFAVNTNSSLPCLSQHPWSVRGQKLAKQTVGLHRDTILAADVSHPLPQGEESKRQVTSGMGFWGCFTARGEELSASPNKN